MSDWKTFGSDVKEQAKAVQRGPRCGLGVLLENSEPRIREILQKVLEDRSNTHSAITRALRNLLGDDAPGLFTVSNHRRGNCLCSRRPR